ncbi:DUF3515 domain-containing protein [Corynebacterium lizhenjunii]|uniref:DUF3515 domain-containing protein n=1 Tax=Corynebacterium lizhenjunii TaxID=2709394 RepID=UPI0013EABD56|nr:DUF3515 domain-containing protein [Corynebacterium lizhenjunii]
MTPHFNRTAIFISLTLSIVMVLGVIFGAKYFYETYAKEPVAMSPVDSPLADSPECAQLIASLPSRFMGHPRAEVAEPAPPGAAAWATDSTQAVTLRCGVDMPFQYTNYAQPTDIDGTSWLQVRDMTPQSTLTTWYTTDRAPAVAVTTFDDQRPTGLEALSELAQQDQPRHPAPLSQLKAATNASECSALDGALPRSLGDYQQDPSISPVTEHTTVWTAPGREAIVLRCGVDSPPGYAAGKQLQQVNYIPWFEDTTLARGTTASTWFALGRSTDIALSVPQDTAAEALVELGRAIAAHTPADA